MAANGEATHEWRLKTLEARMDRLEAKIQTAVYALIGNLVGVCLLLAKAAWGAP